MFTSHIGKCLEQDRAKLESLTFPSIEALEVYNRADKFKDNLQESLHHLEHDFGRELVTSQWMEDADHLTTW